MPKGGGAKTPQLDHFPLNTDMVEKQGGKKVRPSNYSVYLELKAQDLMPGKMYLQQELVPDCLMYQIVPLPFLVIHSHLQYVTGFWHLPGSVMLNCFCLTLVKILGLL